MNDVNNSSELQMQVIPIPGQGGFHFSAVRPEDLGASTYTLVTIVVDITGSVQPFAKELLKMVKTVVEACKKSDMSENLMIRLVAFNATVQEIHGFKPLSSIDINNYEEFDPNGTTALFDATYSSISASLTYGKTLRTKDFAINAAVYIITDGDDNASIMSASDVAEKMKKARMGEEVESLISILVGLKDPNLGIDYYNKITKKLEKFKKDGELTQFVDVGDATVQRLAKLANFVSQSISSQSQVLGSGAPSQPLAF